MDEKLKKTGHGGARAGAGRKPGTLPTRCVNVSLDEQTLAAARAIGDGNVSEGLRRTIFFFEKVHTT